MLKERIRIQSWTSEPARTIHCFRNHVLVGEGCNLLIWSLEHLEHTAESPVIVKVFQNDCPITSISCSSCGDSSIQILVTSFYCYRTLILDLVRVEVQLLPIKETLYAELIAGRIFVCGSIFLYDLNNNAVLQEAPREAEGEAVRAYKGNLGAPDCVSITGDSTTEILVFVATSSRVNICILSEKSVLPVLRFEQPKGVIFSVNFYPASNLIITTSDDRSVSLWKCTFHDKEKGHSSPSPNARIYLRDELDVDLEATLEGHTSRVFQSLLIQEHIISVGEDSNIVLWSLNDLTQPRVIGNHNGSTIWSCAHQPFTNYIYTCADNGSVFQWDLSDVLKKENFSKNCKLFPLSDSICTMSGIILNSKNMKGDYPKLVKSFDESASIVASYSGKVLILDGKNVLYYHEDSNWCPYVALSLSPEKDMYVTGTMKGLVSLTMIEQNISPRSIFSGPQVNLIIPNPEKVLSIHFVSQSEVLVSTVSSLLKYEVPSMSLKWSVKQKSRANCSETWKNVIFIGLSNGKIKIYNRHTGQKLHEFRARHNKLGVGGIVKYRGQLVTGGRDGNLNFFYVDNFFGNDIVILPAEEQPVTHLKTLSLPFLWVGSFQQYDDDLLVCGFQSTDFVIFSLKREHIIGRTDCGGAHRSWDFVTTQDGVGVFSYIREGNVYKSSFELNLCKPYCLKGGFHLDDINSVVQIPNSSDSSLILATGSEDSCVKISVFTLQLTKGQDEKMKFEKGLTETVCSHSSAVRCLDYVELKENSEGILLSGGGKAELVLTKIYLDGIRLKKYENIRRFSFGNTVDFRIMDIKSMLLPSSNSKSENILIAFAACSDGILRIVRENGNFKFSRGYLKATGTNHCLNLIKLGNVSLDYSEVDVVSGTSAGEILTWRVDLSRIGDFDSPFLNHKEWEPVSVVPLNIMSVTAIEILWEAETSVVLAGGDDGTLHRVSNQCSVQSEEAHLMAARIQATNSGILGLQLDTKELRSSFSESEERMLYFISGSKLYKSDLDFGNMACVPIPIHDGKGIVICKTLKTCNANCNPFISFGKGISIFNLDDS